MTGRSESRFRKRYFLPGERNWPVTHPEDLNRKTYTSQKKYPKEVPICLRTPFAVKPELKMSSGLCV